VSDEKRESGLLLRNARVLDYFPVDMAAGPAPRVETVDLRLHGDRVAERGHDLTAAPGETERDLNGRTVMPGHVNAHHHLYSTLAPGMPPPRIQPRNFQEVLTEVWWKLDRALDADAVRLSALAGAWDAVRCGTTLVIDHHSSMTCVGGSLDLIEEGLATAGLRGCLSYEVTDRGGPGTRDTALAENERYLQKCRDRHDTGIPRFRALVGAHASFTLEDHTLRELADLCDRFDTGIHIHLAEGDTDRQICQDRGWPDPLERLDGFGLVRPSALLAHGVDLTPLDLQTVEQHGSWLVHNGRSNMNNGVGRAPVDRFPDHCCLGTDGLDSNMWGELRATLHRGHEGGRGPLDHAGAARLWLGGYRLARQLFGEPFGSLDAGAPADLLICNDDQKTPLDAGNWINLTLFGFHPWDIAEVLVGGRTVWRCGMPAPYDPIACREAARRTWDAMQSL